MAKKELPRTMYSVACACGAKASLDARSFGRPVVCKKCGGSYIVEWGKDPKTRKAVPVAKAEARTRAGIQPGETTLTLRCGCGYSRPVRPDEVGSNLRCPGCDKAMVVEKQAPRRSEAREQKILTLAGPPAPAAPPPRSDSDKPLRVVLQPGTPAFDCPCGERLLLRTGTIGQSIQCPACDRVISLELPRAPVVPRIVAPAPAPEPPAPPPPTLADGVQRVNCPCGTPLPPEFVLSVRDYVCVKCGRIGRMEKVRNPQTLSIMMKPVFRTTPPK